MSQYFDEPVNTVFRELSTSGKGLTSEEAARRLKQYGLNKLSKKNKFSALIILLQQFQSPLVWLLLIAMVISFVIKEFASVYTIGAIVILNALLGFGQEYKAEKAIKHLQKLVALKVRVLRNNTQTEIDAEHIVPGDIILLETGNRIAADARIVTAVNFSTQEAALTGESTPVLKSTEPSPSRTVVADRHSMIFSGTIVTAGRAEAVVTGTGMNTEIGKIASLIQTTTAEPTPLQRKLKRLGLWIGMLVLVLSAIMFGIGIAGGQEWEMMLMTAIALAVAVIPEGLPAVVTTCLALGVQKMAKQNALVRKLPSVETLGACTVICTDKTGTLTHDQMTVQKILSGKQVIEVTGSGYEPKGGFSRKPSKLLLEIGALNNNAHLVKENKAWNCIGDPTEAALLVTAAKAGIDCDALRKKYPRISEKEFTSERKRMTTIHKIANKTVAYTKGAPEIILQNCNRMLVNGRVHKLSKKDKNTILQINEQFAQDALRVLAFAYNPVTSKMLPEDMEKEMVFVGLQAMIDPPRKESKESIELCRKAGIKVVMITGDHITTATAIGKQIGLEGKTMTGAELEKTNLNRIIDDIVIFARVDPSHKLKILRALKKKGHIVAMTGDGVNDAPAIKGADIGISMGITGTDVAKDASDMILADDNFSTIVKAVRRGRVIFDNIAKFVEYLLSCNLGELLTLFIAILVRLPLPVLPLQILWINLVTDGLPALALGVEPEEPRVMQRNPRPTGEHIVSKKRGGIILLIGIMMALGTLLAFQLKHEIKYAQTMAFTTLVLFQMFNVLNQRSETLSLFSLRQNWWLWGAIVISVSLQVLVVHWAPLQTIFSTVGITLMDWAYSALIASSVFVLMEITKVVFRPQNEFKPTTE